ncbi:DHA14-like major facilitator [Mycena galericulata]|nr:DHA14-like major facilitator [Mycena galericulata]
MNGPDGSRAPSPTLRSSPSPEPKPSADSQNEKQQISNAVVEAEEQIEYPTGLKLGFITFALGLSVFLVALPKITDQFKSLDDVGWYGSAYLLTTAAFQLLFGRLYSFLSIKWVYIGAITVFELGSLICGVAPNSNALIIGRAIAGLGSAGIFNGALIIVANTVPLGKRPIYTGLIAGMYGIASVAGPLMGAHHATWRWCLFGGVTLFVITLFFKTPGAKRKSESMPLLARINQFDPLGTLVFIPAIVCLLLALQWGGSKYPWSNGRIIALFVIFGVLISIFIGIQIWKQDMGTVPPRILKKRSILTGTWYSLCMGSSFFIFVYFLPIWFQSIKGVSAVKSGIDNLPMILSLVVSSMLAGGIVTAIGYYTPFLIISSVLMAVGGGLLSTLTVHTGHAHWIGYQVIYGLGVGFGMQQPVMAAQTVLTMQDIPTGTSLVMFMQTLGGALFISVAQNVFTNKLVSGLVSSVPGVNPGIVLSTGATSLQSAVDPKFLPAVLTVYNQALITAFYVSIAMACLSLIGSLAMEWRSIKGKNIEMAMG